MTETSKCDPIMALCSSKTKTMDKYLLEAVKGLSN